MHAAVTAVGVDRPGIVAAVTDALYRVGANLEDSRMAILGGHFALVVVAALPDGTDPTVLRDALRDAERRLDLTVSVGPMRETAPEHTQGEPWVISVYGADHPGIVARVSRLLADNDVNIADLATHVVAGPTPVYVMVLEVTIPGDAPPIEQALRTLAAELGVDVSMHPMEPETL